jgi:pimeloyl-ACP methyl ester carboxylesterase
MPYAKNALDGVQTYYEDLGGEGPPVVLYAGLAQSTAHLHTWPLKRALEGRVRLTLADHRGHGLSEKPHDLSSYTAKLRAADFGAVLDALGLAKAHLLGYSWGARLGFSVGEYQRDRLLSLMLGGHQPYAFRLDGPVVGLITQALDKARDVGMLGFAAHIEASTGRRLAEDVRTGMLDNDAQSVHAAWNAALREGDVSRDLRGWNVPCLIYAAEGDVDFFEDARRAAGEIPAARFLSLPGLNHMTGHGEVESVLPAVLETLGVAS